MKQDKLPWQTILNVIAWVFVIGIISIIKRIFKRKNKSYSPREIQPANTSIKLKNTSRTWWSFYWVFFMIMFVIILFGSVLYLPTLYPKTTSENLTSTGNFQTTLSDNQSVNGTFQMQSLDTKSNTVNNGNVFDLAIISGLLGGFALTIMFARKRYFPGFLQASLLLQGVFYVLATVAFIIFGFYLAADRASLLNNLTQLVPVYVVSFYIGIISFSFSVSLTLWSFIRLLGIGWKPFWHHLIQAVSGK